MMTSQVARALERAGLVERLRDPVDARSVLVAWSPRRAASGSAGRSRDVEAADVAFFAAVAGPALVPRLRALAGRS